MSDLLLEFFCEEIPARMQARAEADLARLLGDALKSAGLTWDNLEAFSGPRRLGLAMSGLPLKTEAVREERKGPRTDAPQMAIEGFLRGTGLSSLDQCSVREDKKGSFYIAVIETPGRDTGEVLKTALPEIARNFPWPKSMKFGEGAKAQRWVRPLHSLICLLGGEIVPVEVFGLTASNITQGHRIHGSGPFTVTGFADYAAQLKANGVILTRAERRQTILDGARAVCAEAGLELIEDEGLLDEVTGLAEQPVAVMGDMDTGFLDLPPEVITLTMRTHQKYFAVRDPKTGALAPKFVTIANQTAPDGGAAIAAGNARVLSARLSDARHFWDLDRAKGLDAMAGELSKVTFHDKLGSVADKTARVAALARELAPAVGADPDLAERAAKLAKADLVSQMVYEFPELQGVMGRYLALEAGLDPQIADAIRDHYKPQGPSDAVPTAPVSAAVALADKLDTLWHFWEIGEPPTGSKDPFALRRAAIGVIAIEEAAKIEFSVRAALEIHASKNLGRNYLAIADTLDSLANYFKERLAVSLKDKGYRHDHIEAAFGGSSGFENHSRLIKRAEALHNFLSSPEGDSLRAGYLRATNILKAEEKKDGTIYGGAMDKDDFVEPEAKSLCEAVMIAEPAARTAVEKGDFPAALSELARLRGPVDAFFEAVVVNDKEDMVRRNRLVLLSRIRAAADAVADFSRLEG